MHRRRWNSSQRSDDDGNEAGRSRSNGLWFAVKEHQRGVQVIGQHGQLKMIPVHVKAAPMDGQQDRHHFGTLFPTLPADMTESFSNVKGPFVALHQAMIAAFGFSSRTSLSAFQDDRHCRWLVHLPAPMLVA